MLHLEERKETLIVTNLNTHHFRVFPNNSLNRIRFKWFNGELISFKFKEDLRVKEFEHAVFQVQYREYSHIAHISESNLIGEIIELFLNTEERKAIELLTEYVETAISYKIQKDLIMYLLGSYSKRLRFTEKYIEVDGIYRVYYDASLNHQEVLSHVQHAFYNNEGKPCFEGVWCNLCLVRKIKSKYKPTWFNIQNQYYVLTKNGCEVLAKVLYLLEAEKHKNDSVFWRQIRHLYKSNWLKNALKEVNKLET